MASVAHTAWSRTVPFICDSCLGGGHGARSWCLASPLLPTTASAAISSYPSRYRSRRTLRWSTSSAADIRPPHRFLRPSAVHRQYSTEKSFRDPVLSGFTLLPSRRLVSVSGRDASKFLQGLVTNNVDPGYRTPFYSAFLDARGRVLWDVFIWPYLHPSATEGHWACYIEVDKEEVEVLVRHLKRHKLRSKVEISMEDIDELGVGAAWGIAPEQLQGKLILASLVDPRGHNFGLRCLIKGGKAPEDLSLSLVDPLQYQIRRYLHGVPEGQRELLRENALPMECNFDLSQGIDFRKGCYVGQELTIRTKHTGVVRKRILPVQFYHTTPPPDYDHREPNALPRFDADWGEDLPESGADIRQLDEEGGVRKGRAAGKFIAGIGNVGLALCRLEMMTSMRVSAEGGSWKPGVEFGIQKGEDGEVLRVKAIVPQWFRERERDMWDKNRSRV